MITNIEYFQLFALICGAGFISYTVHEVSGAIQSMLHDDWLNAKENKMIDFLNAVAFLIGYIGFFYCTIALYEKG